jgi:hypothetical protein
LGNIPTGTFFISNNIFYRSVNEENPDKIKGFRAYIKVKESMTNVRRLSYRTDSNTSITEEGIEEVTIVAIYNLQGVRLDDMQKGVNILQMSNGSTMKVIIK